MSMNPHNWLYSSQAMGLAALTLVLGLAACDRAPETQANPAKHSAAVAEVAVEADAPVVYSAELEFIDLVFTIETRGSGESQRLSVTARRGAAIVGTPGQAMLSGAIDSASAIDLDGDQNAEIVVLTREPAGLVAMGFDGAKFREYRLPDTADAKVDTYRMDGPVVARASLQSNGESVVTRYRFDPVRGFFADPA